MAGRASLQAALCLLALCLTARAAHAQVVKPLPIEAVASIRSFEIQGDLGALSPDGRWLAFAVQGGARPRFDAVQGLYTATGVQLFSYGMSLHLANVASGETRQLTPDGSSSYGPAWSPDGRSLAYYSDRDGAARVWIWDQVTGAHRRLSPAIARPFFGFEKIRWTPDGRQVLVKLLSEDITVAQANAAGESSWTGAQESHAGYPGATVVVRRAHGGTSLAARSVAQEIAPSLAGKLTDLALIDVSTGEARRLTRRGNVVGYRFSPDGSQICAVESMGIKVGTLQAISRIAFLPVSPQGKVRGIDALLTLGFSNTFAWSPDGSQLVYLTNASREPGELFVVPATGGTPRRLTTAPHAKFDGTFRPPLWHPSGNRIYLVGEGRFWSVGIPQGDVHALTPMGDLQIVGLLSDATEERILTPDGGRSAYVETYDRATRNAGMYKVELASGRLTRLVSEQKVLGTRFPSPPQVSKDGQTIAFVAQDSHHPMEIWVAGRDFANPRQLSRVNPQFDDSVFGELKTVEWLTDRGERASGILLLPAGYEAGKRYPVISRVYGGYVGASGLTPFGSQWNTFGLEGADFNNLQVLATRGYAVFVPDIPLRMGTPMTDIPQSVLPGINRLIEMGIADPDRLGLFGQSHGGYTVLSLLVQTQRFKAAVISAGKSNLVSAYGMASSGPGWSEFGQGRMNGSPWEVRENYIENSPFFYFDRITAPLLIIHGDKDSAVPVQHGREIFISLQRLGKEVEMREYRGEEHTIASYENLMDYWTSTMSWFDKYLKTPQ